MAKSIALIPLQGEELLGRVDELITKLGEDFFELGQHLFEIKAGEIYKEREHSSWEAYCDSALPFQWRKADHYIKLWELYCQKLGYDYDEIKHVGWSKLVKVQGLIENKADAKKWISRCENNGRRAIETMVKNEHAKRRAEAGPSDGPSYDRVSHDTSGELAGIHEGSDLPTVDPSVLRHEELTYEDEEGEVVPLHQFQVYLFAAQWQTVMAAMNRAGQLSNSDKACVLLELIASEFNNTYIETADGGVAHQLDVHIRDLERIYDVNITVDVPAGSRLKEMSRLPEEEPKRKVRKPQKKKDPRAKKEKPKAPPQRW